MKLGNQNRIVNDFENLTFKHPAHGTGNRDEPMVLEIEMQVMTIFLAKRLYCC